MRRLLLWLAEKPWQRLGLLAIAALFPAGALALLIAASGLVPIAASDGHWRITDWFLHYTMQRSVSLRAPAEQPPAATRQRLLRGAGAYELSCVLCHGAPGRPQAPFSLAMTPPTPSLASKVGEWSDQQLFWIVHKGVKYTAMPAWPAASREDEVWDMVSFLRELGTMSSERYEELVFGSPQQRTPVAAPEDLRDTVDVCARCHGEHGNGRDGAFPRLAGQQRAYLLESLRAYASGRRQGGAMQSALAGLSDGTLRQLADHYAALPATSVDHDIGDGEGDVQRGSRIADEGLRDRRVPACGSCHEPNRPRSARIPTLSGQPAEYLAQQLRLFKQQRRGGSDHAHLMQPVASGLEDADIDAVAAYYASRQP
ncbi:c-type cytochrome [Hydrocarboniphaga effusa]|uniref:c-type cytochrome n=1 Tax=Hydrocarboniphaga effusa TaxID=243629 RepID=UPI003137CD6E